MKQSQTVGNLMTALAKSQSEFPAFKDDAFGYENRYSYLTLAGIVSQVLPIMGKNGIALTQEDRMIIKEGMPFVLVISRLYCSDEWIENVLMFPLGEAVRGSAEIMQCGSVASYLRRYSLLAMLGISGGDPEIESLNDQEKN